MSARVLLTGATGFLGTRIAPRLVEAGYRVHVVARSSSKRAALGDLDLVWHAGDLEDRASIGRAMLRAREEAGDEALDVVHCGAVISYRSRDRGLQERVNVGGTRHVIDAARLRGVRRVLHISSVVTVGHARGTENFDERLAFNGAALGVDYVDTKRAAEQYALAASSELEVVVVNPSAIFGVAGESSNSAYFLQQVASGGARVAPPGTVGVVGVDDAADGVVAALQGGRPGARYLLSESSLSLRDLLAFVAAECGVAGPRFTIPSLAWRAVGLGASAVDALLPLQRLTPQSIRMVGAHFRADASLARAELGWKPRAIREVLHETLEVMGLLRNFRSGSS